MPSSAVERIKPTVMVTVRRKGLARLRRLYFAQAGESAARYNITFERVVTHLWQVRRRNRSFRLRDIERVDDLVHAIACYDGVRGAWSDLVQQFEQPLVQQCSQTHDEVNAVAMVRKLFIDLRRSHRARTPKDTATLQEFTGGTTMRRWLSDRLNAWRTRAALELLQRRRQWVACSFGPRYLR